MHRLTVVTRNTADFRTLGVEVLNPFGSCLPELLLDHGYEVVGVTRRLSAPNHWRIEHLLDRITVRPAERLPSIPAKRHRTKPRWSRSQRGR